MKKKLLTCLIGIGLAIGMASCGNIEDTTPTTSIVTTTGVPTKAPTQTPTAEPTSNVGTTQTGSFTTPEIPAVTTNYPRLRKTTFENSLKKDGPFTTEMFPSIGENNLLVIPINLDSTKKTQSLLNDIKTSFTGSELETGWHSVNSYYKTSSYGKLDIKATILNEWFTPSKSASYYDSYYDNVNGDYGSTLILREALAYYETQIDYSIYDNDKDGIIDAVWLIYNYDVNFDDSNSDFWAYVYWNQSTNKYDGLEAYTYGFAGTDFMYEETNAYDNSRFVVDAHTYIHETGHMMGLDDYYDYDESVGSTDGGLYGADMMDYGIGDHCTISKLLLGWISPTLISGKGNIEIELTPFVKSGDVLLISDHEVTSIYDEYFLIDYYTNDLLNANDEPILSDQNVKASGIRVLHVSAQKYYNSKNEQDWNPDEAYGGGFKYNNSGTKYKFVNMLRADYASNMEEYLYPESLFTKTSKIFGQTIFNNHKYYSGSSLNFGFTVKSIETDLAKIYLTMK